MDIVVMKAPGGVLVPCDEPSREVVAKWKVGQGINVKATRARDIVRHRRFFAMLNLGYDAWEPPELEYGGVRAVKNFDRFRKDCLVAAGFFEPVVNIKGEVRAEPRSMSFVNMDEDQFAEVYSKVADVLLQKVLTTYTREDLDRVVEEMLRFVS